MSQLLFQVKHSNIIIAPLLRKFLLLAIVILPLSWPYQNHVLAAAGDLDESFSNDGKVTTDFGGSTDEARAIAIQGDGKIVAAGFALAGISNSERLFALARYNTDGSPDTSFGSGGKVTTDFDGFAEEASAVAIQTDGKIVVAGFANIPGTGFDFALARYNSDGSLDAAFGSGGKVTTNFFGLSEFGSGVAIQKNGKIIVAGTAATSGSFDFALARYNTDGSLDAAFGSGGKINTDFGAPSDFANALAIQSNGKIVAAGVASVGTFDFALARYNSDGSLDSTFGSGGKVTTDFGGLNDLGEGLAIQADGKLVVVGTANDNSPTVDTDFALARYNTDGSLDTTFGSGGKITTDFSRTRNNAHAVVIQSNGKIVVTGNISGDFTLVRYNSDGSLDTTFGSGGIASADFTDFFISRDEALALAVQSDGKIVAAGSADRSVDGGKNFALARFQTTLPRITGASVSGKKLIVSGENFDSGAVILLDGKKQKTANDGQNPSTTLIGKKAGKKIARGETVTLQIRNSDGALSQEFRFTLN